MSSLLPTSYLLPSDSPQQEELGAATPSLSFAKPVKEGPLNSGSAAHEGAALDLDSIAASPSQTNEPLVQKETPLLQQSSVKVAKLVRTPLYTNNLAKILSGTVKELEEAPTKKGKRNRTDFEDGENTSLPIINKSLFKKKQADPSSSVNPSPQVTRVPHNTPATELVPVSFELLSIPLDIARPASPLKCPQKHSMERKTRPSAGIHSFPEAALASHRDESRNQLPQLSSPPVFFNYWKNDEKLKAALLEDEENARDIQPGAYSITTSFKTARGEPVQLTDRGALMSGLKAYFQTTDKEVKQQTLSASPLVELATVMLNQSPVVENAPPVVVDEHIPTVIAGSKLLDVLPGSSIKKVQSAEHLLMDRPRTTKTSLPPQDVLLPGGDILFVTSPDCSQ